MPFDSIRRTPQRLKKLPEFDRLKLVMMCSNCGVQEGVIEVRYMAGSYERTLNLCESCARSQGIHAEHIREPRVSDLFSSLLAPGAGMEFDDPSFDQCSGCGTSWAQLRRSGEAGCERCYSVFAEEISRVLAAQPHDTFHRGSLPDSLETFRTLIVDRENLKERLRRAVEQEEFERAAKLRDDLTRMDQTAMNQASGEAEL